MRDIIGEILQTLRNNRLRTALTGLSISWGIFMLIVLLSMARGVTNSFRHNVGDAGPGTIDIYGGVTSRPYHGHREGREIELNEGDLPRIKEKHPEFVKRVSSQISAPSTVISSRTKSITDGYQGVYHSGIDRRLGLVAGRSLNDLDMERRDKVVLMPMQYVSTLFPGDSIGALGKRVSINGLSFRIVGIYKHDWRREVIMPYTTARMMQADKEEVGNITVQIQGLETEKEGLEAGERLRKTLADAHQFDADDESALWIANRFLNRMQAGTALSILDIGVWVLGLLTLISGIVGISNIMFVSVRERTHEIGIRRAIGAKPRQILTQIVAESVAITVIFGYIGIVAGTLVTQLLGMALQEVEFLRNPTVSLSIAAEVTVVLVVAGIAAGLSPAMRALKVKPVEALRDE